MASSIQACLLLSMMILGCSLGSRTRGRYLSDKMSLQRLFGCPPCQFHLCPPLESEGCEPILEPGICGCCPVCARAAGATCGMKTGRCGKGLACKPRPGDPSPMASLIMGRAICTPLDAQLYTGLY